MNHPFRNRLRSGKVILADGAMGTQLYARGIRPDECFEAQVVLRPEVVEQIHRDYITSGAELIETNTFGANASKLAHFGLEDRVREINRRGVRIARSAREICGEPVFVGASIGPTGRVMEPFGQTPREEIYRVFAEQIAALLEGGPDLLVLETFADLGETVEAVRAARDLTDMPIIVQMTFTEDLRTPEGNSPEQIAEVLGDLEVDVIGANCSVGSSALIALTERLVAAARKPVSAMPNAGWPTQVGNRVMYLSSPEYMAEGGRRMAELGAIVVGGCCGTTPTHIRALKSALAAGTSGQTRIEVLPPPEPEPEPALPEDVPEFALKLATKRVISVEISPPRGANPKKALHGARLLRDAGVDAVNVFDSAMARVRMSAMSTAVLISQQLSMEAIVHFTTRDRNLMAIQSDLIGGHALGIRTVLALTGDPPSVGDYAQSKAVYDVDSIGLIRIIKQLNRGQDVGGNSIGTPTRFVVGCALNPTHRDLDWELSRLREKIAAGADFVMTQPVFDADLFKRVLADLAPLPVPVLLGILPLQSYRHALFLHNELPGVELTQMALDRMERAGSDGAAEGLRMAHEMIDECGPLTAGLYIMPSFGRYETAARLVSELLVPA